MEKRNFFRKIKPIELPKPTVVEEPKKSEPKRTERNEDGSLIGGKTPGMIADPFGRGIKKADNTKVPKKKLIPGQTPGILTDPFRKKSGRNPFSREKKQKGKIKKTTHVSVPTLPMSRVAYTPSGPFWYEASKYFIESCRVTQNITDEEMEWIKSIVPAVSELIVKTPPSKRITTEDVEVALLLQSETNCREIVKTNSEKFDPVRKLNQKFVTLSQKQRQKFWVAIAQGLLDKLQ